MGYDVDITGRLRLTTDVDADALVAAAGTHNGFATRDGEVTQTGTKGWDGLDVPARFVLRGAREPRAPRPRRIVGMFSAVDDLTTVVPDVDTVTTLTGPRPEFGAARDADGLRFAVTSDATVRDEGIGPMGSVLRGTAAERVVPRLEDARLTLLVDADRLTDDEPLRRLARRLDAVVIDGTTFWWFEDGNVVEVALAPDTFRSRARRSVSGRRDPGEA